MALTKNNKGFKYKLKPQKVHIEYLDKSFGCTRKLYNVYTDLLFTQLEAQGFTGGRIDYKTINLPTPAAVKNQYPYMREVDSLAFANVQLDFNDAIKKYNTKSDGKTFTKSAKRQAETISKTPTFRDLKGMPSFKSKKKGQNSYTTNNQDGTIDIIDDCYVKLPKIKIPIRFVSHRPIPDGYVIKAATISKDILGNYYIAFLCEYYVEETVAPITKVVGLDYSQQNFFVSSDGEKANYPHYYRNSEEQLKNAQQKLSRKTKNRKKDEPFSKNALKQKKKISKLQKKISNQRLDWIHKKSFEIAKKYDLVSLEDIDLRCLAQCLSFGKNVHDNGFGMFRTFVQYKLEDRGKRIVKVDKWYPSSKTCNDCGYVYQDLVLAERYWTCPCCGKYHDRDENAANNIEGEGLRLYQKTILEAS